MNARDQDQAFRADGTRGVEGWVQLAVTMPSLHSRKLSRGILPIDASTYSSRLRQELN